MISQDILAKIKASNLVGRGGACFPVADKWLIVKKAVGENKYVVCNGAEGEPGVEKDGYILDNYGDRVIDGMKIAIDFLSAKEGIIYLNNKYVKKSGKKLKSFIGNIPIKLFIKPLGAGYIGGEESSALNAIEGRRIEPRLRPPFPTINGLWNSPTLINNVETFYNVSLVAKGEYKNKRFYTISGDCLKAGVYQLPENFNIIKVLKETKNYPNFPFFVQIGGLASGEVLNESQLKRPVTGAGSIAVLSRQKYSFKKIIKNWLEYFLDESCGQCTPCREGVYRLKEIIIADKIDWLLFKDLLNNLSDSAFCGLGCAVPMPIISLINNILPLIPDKKIDIKNFNKKSVGDCFR